MESLPKNIEDYLRELTTLDVRAVDYYFDDSRGEGGEIVAHDRLNPLQHPNLPRYRIVTLWDLRHYDEKSSGYKRQIRELSAKIIDSQKVQLLTNFERISEKYLRFWKWYAAQHEAYRKGKFNTFEFILGLSDFFNCESNAKEFAPNTHSLAPRFLHNLHDAAMLKHGTLKRMIQEIKAIAPPVATSTDVKGVQEKDPYNAKVKAKFLDMVIEAGIIKDGTYRNNNEKFTHYANILKSEYGLVVNAGTLENNWYRQLNGNEKAVLRALFLAQDLKKLAVKVATHQ
jgi:hypothetical protein